MTAANAQFKVENGLFVVGQANVQGSLNVSGNFNVGGVLTAAVNAQGDIIPSTIDGQSLGNTTWRWTVYAINISANTITGNLDWSYITSKPNPNIQVTLTGDVTGTGNATLTALANGAMSFATSVTKTNFSALTVNSNTVWHAGNDGLGSGLDADLLDGLNTGSSTGNIPISNGTLMTTLNADLLDGQHGAFYQNASNMSTGSVPTARLGSGTANSTTFLRGDQSWSVPVGTNIGTSANATHLSITSSTGTGAVVSAATGSLAGVMSAADRTKLDGIASGAQPGTVTSVANGSGLSGGTITSTGTLSIISSNGITTTAAGVNVVGANGITVTAAGVNVLAGAGLFANTTGLFVNLTSTSVGTVPTARLGSGTANSTTFLRGDQSYAIPVVNLGQSVNTTTVTVTSSAGSSTVVGAATGSAAGVMTSTDKSKLDGIASGAQTGTVTSVATGSGLTGGTITTTGTLSVVAGGGIVANSTGVHVNASSVPVGTLPVARGGTGTTSSTGTGSVVLSASPTLTGNVTAAGITATFLYAGGGAVNTPNPAADDIVVNIANTGGMSILTPNTTYGALFYGDQQLPYSGQIRYDHTVDEFMLYTADTLRFRIGSYGANVVGNTFTSGQFLKTGATKGFGSINVTSTTTAPTGGNAGDFHFIY